MVELTKGACSHCLAPPGTPHADDCPARDIIYATLDKAVNDSQVGGTHYRRDAGGRLFKIQHWDYANDHGYDYFQGVISKYVDRWKIKNGLEDLYKARQYLEKYIALEEAKQKPPSSSR